MEDSTPPPDEVPQFECPFCGKSVGVSDPAQTVFQCPDCGQQFFAPTTAEEDSTATHEQAQAQAADEEARREAELSELRISQVANLRRGAIRSRSWFIVGAVACVVGASQFVYFAIERYRGGERHGPLRDALGAAILLMIVPLLHAEDSCTRERDCRVTVEGPGNATRFFHAERWEPAMGEPGPTRRNG